MVGLVQPAAALEKIGIVNVPRIMDESPQAKAATETLKGEFEPRRKKLKEEEDKLKEMEDRLNRDSAIMSETERMRLERDLVGMQRDLKRKSDEFREDLGFRQNEERAKMLVLIREAIESVGKNGSFDVILLAEGVAFARPTMDVTDEIIKYLEKK